VDFVRKVVGELPERIAVTAFHCQIKFWRRTIRVG
jgi:hypothetical protein